MEEVVNNKRDLAILSISEYEAITVYTFSIVSPGLFGGKCSTNPDIRTLRNYTNWRKNSLQTDLGYDIEKKVGPSLSGHQDDHHDAIPVLPPLRALASEMASNAIKFISDIVR